MSREKGAARLLETVLEPIQETQANEALGAQRRSAGLAERLAERLADEGGLPADWRTQTLMLMRASSTPRRRPRFERVSIRTGRFSTRRSARLRSTGSNGFSA